MLQLAEMLQNFGAWGICAVLICAIVYLYRSSNILLEKRNDQFVELLRETNALLHSLSDQCLRVEQILDRVERKLNE